MVDRLAVTSVDQTEVERMATREESDKLVLAQVELCY